MGPCESVVAELAARPERGSTADDPRRSTRGVPGRRDLPADRDRGGRTRHEPARGAARGTGGPDRDDRGRVGRGRHRAAGGGPRPGRARLAGSTPSSSGSPSRSAAPVAATASFVIWGWVIDSWIVATALDVAAPFLRAGVSAAVQVAPLVALGAAAWVVILRRVSAPLPLPPPSTPPPATPGL